MGPCMCGDLQCPSCGPAQGNWKCPLCGTWVDEGCVHMEEAERGEREWEELWRDEEG